MAEGIDKPKVKDYLDFGNKDLIKEMKEKMERPENWGDFKRELTSLIVAFSKSPTSENRKKIDSLVSTNYITNRIFGKDAVDRIFRDLGVRTNTVDPQESEKKNPRKENREAYREAIYEALGMESPAAILRRRKRELKDKSLSKPKNKANNKKKFTRSKTRKAEKNEKTKTSEEPKKDGKLKKAVKKAYFKLTASILMAPGEVPPEILQENREMITRTSEKLEKLTADLRRAHGIVSHRNQAKLDVLPEELKDLYESMAKGEMDEKTLEHFESVLEHKQDEQLGLMRETLDKLQRTRVESELRTFAEGQFPDMPKEELDQEIEYAILDSRVDKDGKLILPKRSIFSEVLVDENGEVKPGQDELVGKLTTYAKVPKASELTDKELVRFSRKFRDLEEMDSNSKEYAVAEYLHTHPEMLVDEADNMMQQISDTSKEYLVVRDVATEAELGHKIMITREVGGQLQVLQDIVTTYDIGENVNGKIEEKDSRKRQLALKIARKKVQSLEKAGLSRVVAEGEKTSRGVIKRAKSVLLPELENARNKGNRTFNREFRAPEDIEPAE